MIENRIKDVDSKDNSVNIMFRPTHFVILFAVVLYANALPAPPSIRVSEGLEKTSEKQSTPIFQDEGGLVKGDLDTDAQTHLAYSYYSPRWGFTPGQIARSGWGIELIKPYGWQRTVHLY